LSRFLWHEATKSIASPAGWDNDHPCGTREEGGSEALQIAAQVDYEESCVSVLMRMQKTFTIPSFNIRTCQFNFEHLIDSVHAE